MVSSGSKSLVFRLHGLPEVEAPVIAKQCAIQTARIEQTMYENVLPHLPFRSLRYYGFADDGTDDTAWIFLEDAGDSTTVEPYTRLFADWLGVCHRYGADLARQHLPARGTSQYLDHLRRGRDRINGFLAERESTERWRTVLESLVQHCNLLESSWGQIEAICRMLPLTLVHGDLERKHLRLINEDGNEHLIVLDWEIACWGTPVPDLERLSPKIGYDVEKGVIRAYLQAAGWTGVSWEELERLAQTGVILRSLAAVDWASQSLILEFIDKPMWKLWSYDRKFSNLVPRVLDGPALS